MFYKEINSPTIIFGSYAKGTQTKDSDIDILTINAKNIPDHLVTQKIHHVDIKKNQIKNFRKQPLFKEIKKDYVVLKGFELFTEVFENE